MKTHNDKAKNPHRTGYRWVWYFGGLLATLCSIGLAHDQTAASGKVNFDISCNADSQAAMNNGLSLLHNMMYVQAEDKFRSATTSDGNCAMLHWGIAMSRFHPLWAGQPSKDDIAVGTAAIEQALSSGSASPREQAYIEAAKAFYVAEVDVGYRKRLERWATGQKSVYQSYPDDVDAAALHALAHLAIADKTDDTFTNQREAGALLETIHNTHPEHPGGYHYLIHAYDNPALAEKARKVAETYDSIAPDVPHALHMPTHIFTRMGMWQQSIDWNRRSAEAATRQSPESMTLGHYAHAVDYLVYAYMQQGQLAKAQGEVAALNAVANHQDNFGSAYALAAAPARLALEQDNWADAAIIPVNHHAAVTWSRFPQMSATTQFARGLGAARSGDTQGAAVAVEALGILHQKLVSKDQPYWATLVSSQQNTVQAWLALVQNQQDEAVKLMVKAADLEDSVSKHPVTPGWILPARELLGDLYVQLDRPDDALAAYETTLARSPNRSRSLRGAESMAIKIGDSDRASVFRDQLHEINSAKEG